MKIFPSVIGREPRALNIETFWSETGIIDHLIKVFI